MIPRVGVVVGSSLISDGHGVIPEYGRSTRCVRFFGPFLLSGFQGEGCGRVWTGSSEDGYRRTVD